MRWNQLLAGLIAALSASACLAETPQISGDQSTSLSLVQQGRLFGGLTGPNWWSRFGEPINATALAQAESSPSDKSGFVPPIPMYGDGYVFRPGSCDCPPPCIWQLWAGYYQNPLRCHPGSWLHRHGGCNDCGAYAGGGCGPSCTTSISCGCTTPVTCTSAASSCGCKPVCGKCRHCHLGMWHGFGAHWSKPCDSCSAPLSCGCTTAVAPPYGFEKQAGKMPLPLPEEAALFPLPRLN
jgi:hypothetical protein